ncbi:hypothetical protein XM38_033560 [Halomicronema hongdechloris C2206]|uniref:Chromosome segregation ATPase n=1 Tax=Halomicronema hongdechloris C2206 TaxID=1641165 RepID=A0A1Z3HQ19_9CYAN|nr:hypothetical protein [Halomicronema hongdechloris]ASC72399.1 hypothetical protein XM38_033560 [Halomicronema hongdechloris C2206]
MSNRRDSAHWSAGDTHRRPSPRKAQRLSSTYTVPSSAPRLHTSGSDEIARLHRQMHSAPPVPSDSSSLWQRLARHWQLSALTVVVIFAGLGAVSAVSLFRIPNLPNCRAIFWPTASASTRLQCADAYAAQGEVDSLLAAIDLIDGLPQDHPLRAEINERIEVWAEQILDLAEQTFHQGKLDQAIAIAQRIPQDTSAAQQVRTRVSRWKETWEEAEAIYEAAQAELEQKNFREAFAKATQLLSVGNDYWETTQYEALTQLISQARQDLNRLGQARRLGQRGTLEGFQEAFKLVASIDPDSPLHREAQRVLRQLGREVLDAAEAALKREDASTATQLLNLVPREAGLRAEISDFYVIIQAYELAWRDTVAGLEAGIQRLQSIGQDQPLYARAQGLMQRWQSQIEGLSKLEWARRLADPGTVSDLRAAISEADQISRTSPAWSEAERQIDRWQRQIETIEDGPILERAKGLARGGDLQALRTAIQEARRIEPGRVLYREAQDQIDQWTAQIQRQEDEPLLRQARQLANAGRYSEAVTVAARIGAGRVLYDEAQGEIQAWRRKVQGQQQLQRAYQVAQQGTVDALVEAIDLAQQIPADSSESAAAVGAANQWSWDLLRVAETEARYDLNRAIAIAQRIPPRTEAYAQAQLRLQEWQDQAP